jgi:hypothetical protein
MRCFKGVQFGLLDWPLPVTKDAAPASSTPTVPAAPSIPFTPPHSAKDLESQSKTVIIEIPQTFDPKQMEDRASRLIHRGHRVWFVLTDRAHYEIDVLHWLKQLEIEFNSVEDQFHYALPNHTNFSDFVNFWTSRSTESGELRLEGPVIALTAQSTLNPNLLKRENLACFDQNTFFDQLDRNESIRSIRQAA